ncbi:MAG: hypothetical protein AAF086_10120 [Planctomycetota bacterium]
MIALPLVHRQRRFEMPFTAIFAVAIGTALCGPQSHAGVVFDSRTSSAEVTGQAFNAGENSPSNRFVPDPISSTFTGPTTGGAAVGSTAVSPDATASVSASAFEDNAYLDDGGFFFGANLDAQASASRLVPNEEPEDFIQNTDNATQGSASLDHSLFFTVTQQPQPFTLQGEVNNVNNGFVILSLGTVASPFSIFSTARTGDDTSDPVIEFRTPIDEAGILDPGQYVLNYQLSADVGPFNFNDRAGIDVSLIFVPEPGVAATLLLPVALLLQRRRNQARA